MQQIENQQLGFQISDAQLVERSHAQRALLNLSIAAFMSISLIALGLAFFTLGVNLQWGHQTGFALSILGGVMGIRVIWHVMWRGPW
jgi:hypothetical protein